MKKRIIITLLISVCFVSCELPPIIEFPVGEEQPMGGCNDYNPLKNPYFGDLHVHTSYSFDAVTFDTTNDPDAAYRFAKGDLIYLPPLDSAGNPTRPLQMDRPLDFTAVTDHAEGFAETAICFDEAGPLYASPYCMTIRGSEENGQLIDTIAFLIGVIEILVPGRPLKSTLCTIFPQTCEARKIGVWKRTQQIAEQHYDRSEECSFTTFVGYEYTATPMINNLHRNVIFRNHNVPELPVAYHDAPYDYQLWNLLDRDCREADIDCEVLTIPHNSNEGGGWMFQPFTFTETSESIYTSEEALQRQRLEPLMEIYQHKGASECMQAAGNPLASEDELCDTELLVPGLCTGSPDDSPDCAPLCSDLPFSFGSFLGICVEPGDFARSALRNGLTIKETISVNPFKFGFIGGTDTHNASPGYTSENRFKGHHGVRDDTSQDRLMALTEEEKPFPADIDNPIIDIITLILLGARNDLFNSGGLAVVWAEQNSRDVLFDAMKNREAYGTSGTRIIARFFGGWDYPENLCEDPDFIEIGYDKGVPMGSDLPEKTQGDEAPIFAVSAMMDAGTDAEPGTPLQRIQIIKGWEDNGETFEKIFDVAGGPDNSATVDLDTCAPQGAGFETLCAVWQDPEFDKTRGAFYYARIVENPTCRWSRWECNAVLDREGLACDTMPEDSRWRKCCDGSLVDTIQERAWTSPIWYTP